MFAVIKTGGLQYSVAEDQKVRIGRIEGEPGQIVQIGNVLMLGGDKPELGAPMVSGASVAVEIIEQSRGAEGDRLQEAPPQEFAAQARPPAGLYRGPDLRDPDRRCLADQGPEAEARAQARAGRS